MQHFRNSYVAEGMVGYASDQTADPGITIFDETSLTLDTIITIASATTYELRHYFQKTTATSEYVLTFGTATNTSGANEVYLNIQIEKIS